MKKTLFFYIIMSTLLSSTLFSLHQQSQPNSDHMQGSELVKHVDFLSFLFSDCICAPSGQEEEHVIEIGCNGWWPNIKQGIYSPQEKKIKKPKQD